MMRLIHTSKSPFEIFMLAALLISGVSGITRPEGSSRAVDVLPLWAQLVFYSGLAAASALGLLGALTNRLWSLFAERGALLMIGLLLIAYAAAIVVVAGIVFVLAVSALTSVALAAACFVRVRQVSRDIRRILDGG